MQEKEIRKEKRKVYNKVLDFINAFEPNYDPLANRKYWGMKVDILMDNFAGIMQTMNKKKNILTQAYLDKAIEVERMLSRKMILNLGQCILHKKFGYIVARSVQYVPPYKRPKSESPPDTHALKKQKLEQGLSSNIEEYSLT